MCCKQGYRSAARLRMIPFVSGCFCAFRVNLWIDLDLAHAAHDGVLVQGYSEGVS
jgi:hypothetical protein